MTRIHRASLLASSCLSALAAYAQVAPATVPAPTADKPRKVETLTVTATPLDAATTQMSTPATVLSDEDLRRRQGANLGETVGRELGVQSSAFGPGAGRPVIRGMDGPRIRVMQNSLDTLDLSTISPDHGVSTETLNARQVEILRGPASLLYGSGAIGGVVNVVTGAIPQEVPTSPTGAVEFKAGSANREKSAAFDVTAGAGSFALNANGTSRESGDYKIPGGRLANTAVESRGGSLGGSFVGARGFAGLALSTLRNDYGIPSPEGPRIAMRQTRTDASAELADPFAFVTRARFRAGYNDYEHQEFEGSGEKGTFFTNKASDARLELAHVPWKDGKGALGFQVQDRKFAAFGDEAIIPRTRGQAQALFLVEQKRWGAWTVDAGARIERERRDPEAGFVARRFSLGSYSGGVVWAFAPGLSLSVNLSHAERAPSIEELYSNGPHHATETFDIGDANLRKERTRALDVMLRGEQGSATWKVALFANRATNYVFQQAGDADGDGIADRVDEEGALQPDGEFLRLLSAQSGARFRGVEAEWRWRPAGDGPGLRFFGDLSRGERSNGEPLPRQAPSRLRAELDWRAGPWSAWLSTMRIARQSRVAPLESPTPGHTRVDAEVSYLMESAKGRRLTVYAQGSNLLNEEIRVHTSYLKEFAPQMGRSILMGLRGEY